MSSQGPGGGALRFIRQLDTGPLRDRNLARQGERYPAIGQGWSLRTATALWPATNEERGSRLAVMNCANALLTPQRFVVQAKRVSGDSRNVSTVSRTLREFRARLLTAVAMKGGHPSALSSDIMTVKPAMKPSVATSTAPARTVSGMSSSTTTYNMAPAAAAIA